MDCYEKEVICPIAACRGKFYFNSLPTSLGVIDFSGPALEFSSITVEDTIQERCGYGEEYGAADVFLVESNDELYMVSRLVASHSTGATNGDVVRIYMMDFSARRWCRVEDLGDRSFFVSLFYFGVSYSGCGGDGCDDFLQRNRVYFVLPGQKVLQIFDVKDGSAELQSLDEAPMSDKAFWVLPADP